MTRRQLKIALGLVSVLVGWLVTSAPASATVPGSPQVPQAPAVVFFENFQHNVTETPIRLTDYTPAFSFPIAYTADPYWLSDCNGTILMGNSPDSDGPGGANNLTTCATATGYTGVRRLAWALGSFDGLSDPGQAPAVTAWTEAGPTVTGVQFETCGALPPTITAPCSTTGANLAPIPLVASNRFITFSVEAAETSCDIAPNRVTMFFYFRNAAGQEIPLFNTASPPAGLPGTPITPCTDPSSVQIQTPEYGGTQPPLVNVGDYAGDRALLFSGSSLGIVLRNQTAASGGNDGAFTNIRVLDATPQLDKQFVPDVVERGQTTDLVFTITNTTDLADKQGWSFDDTLPAGLVVASPERTSTTCGAGTTVSAPAGGDRISVTSGDLPASTAAVDGGDPYCQVIVKVTSSVNGTYTNLANDVSVTGLNPPGDASVYFGDADLAIVKSARPTRVVAGRRVRFTLRVVNHGPLAARNVVVSDPLPAGVRFLRASPGCALSNGAVHCSLASLAVDARAVFRVLVRVSPGFRDGLVNTATVSSDTPDPDLGNNSSTVSVPVRRRADLQITKVAVPADVTAGGQVHYVLVVHNNGPSKATQVTVTDPLAPQLRVISAVTSQGTCSTAFGVVCRLGSLTTGASAQIVIAADVDQTTSGQVTNTATVVGAETDPNLSNNSARASVAVHPIPIPEQPSERPEVVVPQQDVADLSIAKRVHQRLARPGQRLTYTLTVTNHGPQDATGVVLNDTPDLALRLISVHPSQGRCSRSLPLSCQLGTIKIYRRVTIRIVARAIRPGLLANAATVSADQRDPRLANNLSRATLRIHPSPPKPAPPPFTG